MNVDSSSSFDGRRTAAVESEEIRSSFAEVNEVELRDSKEKVAHG
jgi:hypothetical protein